MVLTKPITNGNKSWIIRLILTAVVTTLITSTGWLYAQAAQRITRDEVNIKLATQKQEIKCEMKDLENRTNERMKVLENRFDKTMDRFSDSVEKAIDRLNLRLDRDSRGYPYND